jgi:hypothetical protein
MRELRQAYDDELSEVDCQAERQLVDRVVSLANAAADGGQVQQDAVGLNREWDDATGFWPDEHGDVDLYDGPMPIGIKRACEGVLWELSEEARRYAAARQVTAAALDYVHWETPAENTRLLLRFGEIVSQAEN